MSTAFEADTLANIRSDLEIYNDMILEVSKGMLKDKISKYPIFVAHKEEVIIGRMVIDHVALATNWTISASHLEEFVNKQIIAIDKIEDFKRVYKDPTKFICLFAIHNGKANFIFNPYL